MITCFICENEITWSQAVLPVSEDEKTGERKFAHRTCALFGPPEMQKEAEQDDMRHFAHPDSPIGPWSEEDGE